ncbi:reverse transcriptase domain-containing protein [Rhodococcus sp. P1Y]|uniref:reverse transcriptase domain-containing protein n=1 Tax=Rhodococcus sp. P1Y TaxID=1302308 RepID=UPI000EAB7AA7|nr:reverse transcriptase domain-containing protein [Rhodococcus sp. P1Y]AYJ50289.1 hypothetical protein D8W71_20645 [Rhodococcus sp. P1Y]
MIELAGAIRDAATDRIRAHERRVKQANDESKRRQRRSTDPLRELEVRTPRYWAYHPSHEPFHVRARAASIGHAIDLSIKAGTYEPLPPAGFQIPKPGGKDRTVTAFAIADEVVSKRLYKSLMSKNRTRLSARSYAYRKDLGVHDAITHMQSEWSNEHRIYVAQYDFADYFGSIDHDHVLSTISALKLAVTRTERRLLKAFMTAPHPTLLPGTMPTHAGNRDRGIHQGTTISLFLANIAATPLDREFERLGVSFTRYADDIVVWSRDYSNLSRAVDELHRFSDRTRCAINHAKSPGVQLLTTPESVAAEFTNAHSLEFLSHRLGLRDISLSSRAISLAQTKIDQYIYNHLLREPIKGTQNILRLRGGLDRDYIALLWQLRRYLYGNLSEAQLRRLMRGPLPPEISLAGLLGRHPMVNDVGQLREFDAWLSTQVWLALRKRSRILHGNLGSNPVPEPWGFTQKQLCAFMTKSTFGSQVDGRLPSTVRMSELVRRAVRAHGTRIATHTVSLYSWR